MFYKLLSPMEYEQTFSWLCVSGSYKGHYDSLPALYPFFPPLHNNEMSQLDILLFNLSPGIERACGAEYLQLMLSHHYVMRNVQYISIFFSGLCKCDEYSDASAFTYLDYLVISSLSIFTHSLQAFSRANSTSAFWYMLDLSGDNFLQVIY